MLLIDRKPFDHDHHAHLAAVIRGHQAIIAAIEAHAQEEAARRLAAEEAHHAELDRGQVGGAGP